MCRSHYEQVEGLLASKQQGDKMSRNDKWLVEYEQVERCNECPYNNGCIRECVMKEYTHEDVAKIRGEEIN